MKTKLLKEIRKRYQIIHHPNGIMSSNTHYDYNIFALYDSYLKSNLADFSRIQTCQFKIKPKQETQWQKPELIFNTEQECINYLKKCLIKRIKSDYRYLQSRKTHNINKTNKKVWYNG